ncbi:MAG: ABC transporter permease, partial [Candidatus Latescibacteria bacterium]|nr:ABC transporter permease [Candidatus Latescibacterota bacterium]
MIGLRLNPITRKRLQRFRRIRRGFYSFAILATLTVLSLFSNYLANRRAIVVSYEGTLYFPTFQYHDMATFDQEDEYGFDDVEANYMALQARFDEADGGDWVWMPLVPFDPYEPDFNYDEPPPNAPDGRHWFGTDSQGRDVLARLLYGFRIS